MRFNFSDLTKICVYNFYVRENELLYIGACRFTTLMNFPDARSNSVWREVTSVAEFAASCRVEVLAVYDSEDAARLHVETLVRSTAPSVAWANKHGTTTRLDKAARPVACNDTGESYPSVRAAALANGAATSALFNHLAGKSGYVTVKGKTFRYI